MMFDILIIIATLLTYLPIQIFGMMPSEFHLWATHGTPSMTKNDLALLLCSAVTTLILVMPDLFELQELEIDKQRRQQHIVRERKSANEVFDLLLPRSHDRTKLDEEL